MCQAMETLIAMSRELIVKDTEGNLIPMPAVQLLQELHASSTGLALSPVLNFPSLNKANFRAEMSVPDCVKSPQQSGR